jgi:hypothetical protein
MNQTQLQHPGLWTIYQMTNQETVHVHVKNPNKSPEPIRQIGIFPTFNGNSNLLTQVLSEVLFPEVMGAAPTDPVMVENLKAEVMKILLHATVLALKREDGLTTIIIQEQKK